MGAIMSRGMKVLNPGNIRISHEPWIGKITPSKDSEFETFDTIEHGIRAMGKILLTYYRYYHLDTIEELISKWAPPSENDTESYIKAVCDELGLKRTQPLDLLNPIIMMELLKAICFHECGKDCVTIDQLNKGVEMALA